MPDTDTISSSEASSSKKSGKELLAKDDGDLSRQTLEAVVKPITSIEPEQRASSLEASVSEAFAALLPKSVNKNALDPCSNPSQKIAPFCGTKKLTELQADFARNIARRAAVAALKTAVGDWSSALRAYDLAILEAEGDLQVARAAAANAYPSAMEEVVPLNFESSRASELFFTMKSAIASALQAYTGSAAAAAGTLDGAAGALIAAAQAFDAAVTAAECQRFVAIAAAEQTFWQNYESVNP